MPLPLSQDFAGLKKLGLEYIQLHSGEAWSNLNAVDPGVTILDQLCYALTELGYVNDFPVRDILTRRDGKLKTKDLFYKPEEILTTSPVTINDYRKYIIDGVPAVTNVIISPIMDNTDDTVSGVYNVYLQVDDMMVDDAKRIPGAISRTAICNTVFFYLNKRRNINEFFNMPQVLHKKPHAIKGEIVIENAADIDTILSEINVQVRNYIFPDVTPVSYDDLHKAGVPTNEIFNGPVLLHGWIPTNVLGSKKQQLQVFELVSIIGRIPGVSAIFISSLDPLSGPAEVVYTEESSVFTLDVFESVASRDLVITCKGETIKPTYKSAVDSQLMRSQKANPNIRFGSTPDAETPKGTFRNIDSYYSIQNTFPEIYAVGEDAVDADAPPHLIAQSRQLKGYLTLFDQVLANQFSQLGNLDRLFSFKNAISDADTITNFGRRHHKYPAPYKTFAPTYFYQPLYKVPLIRPLLKNDNMFNFSVHAEPEKIREERSWQEYKYNPYNPYIRGLMDFMEDERNSVERRNVILDFLLAQNGESPYVINQLIDPLLYTGDEVKGRIIFKSLYLQNLGLLSYARQKAYNYLGAKKISPELPEISESYDNHLLGANTMDFIFRSGKVDELEKIRSIDLINYSTLELKLFLLFGLRQVYLNYISEYYLEGEVHSEEEKGIQNYHTEMRLARWMISQRRGVIAIETGLLFRFGGEKLEALKNERIFENSVLLFFPSFMPNLNTDAFKARLQLFYQGAMPVEVPMNYFFIETNELWQLITLFCAWHNELVYDRRHRDYYTNEELRLAAELLALHILTISDQQHARHHK